MYSLLSMRWRDLLFAHWPVDPETVDRALPDGLSVDTYDGDAYLGVVPFVMSDIRPRGAPVGLGFGELNLRTYVTAEGIPDDTAEGASDVAAEGSPGVYFFNLDADDRVGVRLARSIFRLPYYRAAMDIETDGDGDERTVAFRSRRLSPDAEPARFEGRYGPDGAFSEPKPGSKEAFLTERYRFYTADDRGRIYYGDIEHEPWRLAPAWAEITENTLFGANGFERPDGGPELQFAAPIDVTAGRIRRL